MEFSVYLQLGFEHITDTRGYDHILFVIALCAAYDLRQWKELLWMVTAFTIGHSITLALATLGWIGINAGLIEFLIPVTIFLTSIVNVIDRQGSGPVSIRLVKYSIALGFGLVHGMGFSSFLQTVLGNEESIVWPLFAFNVGLEIGQIVVVAITLSLGWMVTRFSALPKRDWTMLLSGGAAGIAILLMFERL